MPKTLKNKTVSDNPLPVSDLYVVCAFVDMLCQHERSCDYIL
jgi:hypothetical protein